MFTLKTTFAEAWKDAQGCANSSASFLRYTIHALSMEGRPSDDVLAQKCKELSSVSRSIASQVSVAKGYAAFVMANPTLRDTVLDCGNDSLQSLNIVRVNHPTELVKLLTDGKPSAEQVKALKNRLKPAGEGTKEGTGTKKGTEEGTEKAVPATKEEVLLVAIRMYMEGLPSDLISAVFSACESSISIALAEYTAFASATKRGKNNRFAKSDLESLFGRVTAKLAA